MDLKTFEFPTVTQADMAFPTYSADPKLLAEAKARGFYNGHSPYNALFSSLFFSGGKVKYLEGVDEDFRKRVWAYLRAFMGSWSPSHEEKDAICAMLLSEICQPELDKTAKAA